MKRFIRCMSLLMAMLMLMAVPAYAAETAQTRASNYFAASSVYLHKTSSTQFEAWFDVTAVNTMQKLGASKIKIQRSTDKVNWTTVKTYNMEDYSQMIKSNTVSHDDCVTYTYTSGYYYRAVVTLYAKNSSGYAEYDVTTAILNLR